MGAGPDAALLRAAREMLEHWPAATGAVRMLDAGHVNDTFLVGLAGDAHILQRINAFVFPDPRAVMRNLAKALAHRPRGQLVAPVATTAGELCASDAEGGLWRLFPRLPARSFANLPDDLLAPAGAAFGGFLADFAAFEEDLEPVIPRFHDLAAALRRLDDAPRANDATPELRQVEAMRGSFAAGGGNRVIHGDCKINNLLFHPSDPAVLAVIDLDTLMIGDPAWDFGDLVRSAFAGSEETARPAPPSAARFERLCQGFAGAFGALEDAPRFAIAPAHMSFMLAARFLADHLQGDAYFKVARRGDNLLRARSQLELASRFQDAAPAFARIIERRDRGAQDRM